MVTQPVVAADIPQSVLPAVVTPAVVHPATQPPGPSPFPAEIILGNGLVQGLIAAGILYLALPELNLGFSRQRILVILAFTILAGTLGLFQGVFRVVLMLLRPRPVQNSPASPGATGVAAVHGAGSTGLAPTSVTVLAAAIADPEVDAAAQRGGPLAHPLLKGLLLGLVLCAVLSVLKPTFGLIGLALVVGGLVTVLGATLFILLRVHVVLATRLGISAPGAVRLRLLTMRLFQAGGVAICLAGLMVVAETLAPEGGWLQTTVQAHNDAVKESAAKKDADEKAAERDRIAKAQAEEEQKWSDASFLLTSPRGYAVAIRREGEEPNASYRVVARGREKDALSGQRVAWESRNPIVANDPTLAERAYQEGKIGKLLPDSLTQEVVALWKPKEFLPTAQRLVSFEDVSLGRRRTGYVVETVGGVVSYCDLIPVRTRTPGSGGSTAGFAFPIERLDLSRRSLPGSLHDDVSVVELRERNDFLEWCVFNVLQTLQKNQSRPVHLLVDGVAADVDGSIVENHAAEGALKSRKADYATARDRLESASRATDGALNVPSRVLAMLMERLDKTEERQRLKDYRLASSEQLKQEVEELRSEIAQMRQLVDGENRLTAEIRSLLNRVGIGMVERSDRAKKVLSEKVNGQRWLRPDSNQAIQTELVSASHLLLTEIRKPERAGLYQLSMRLVDVTSGTILWEDQGDRVPAGEGSVKPAVTTARQETSAGSSGPLSRWAASVWFDGTITPRRGRQIAVNMAFKKSGAAVLTASVDCPHDRKFDVKADAVRIDGARLTFGVPGFGAHFTGVLNEDGDRIDGFWTMNGETAPIGLRMRH